MKNLAASLYERRKSNRYDNLRKQFIRDLEALNDLAGYWHSYNSFHFSVAKYIQELRSLYEKRELDEYERDMISHYHSDVDEACTEIIDRGQTPPDPGKRSGTVAGR